MMVKEVSKGGNGIHRIYPNQSTKDNGSDDTIPRSIAMDFERQRLTASPLAHKKCLFERSVC